MPPPPIHVQAKLRTAFEMLNAGQLEEARRHGKLILKSSPKEPNALYLLGVIAHQTGNLKEAARFFEKSYALEKTNLAALSGMGIVRLDQKRFQEAARIFERLTVDLPGEAILKNNLAISYDGMNAPDKAEAAARAALVQDPTQSGSISLLSRLLSAKGAVDQAVEVLENGVAHCPSVLSLWLDLADALIRCGRDKAAEAALERAVGAVPDTREIRRRLASMYINRGRFEESRSLYKALIAEDPKDLDSLFDLADLEEARPSSDADGPFAGDAESYRRRGLDVFQAIGETEIDPITLHRVARVQEKLGNTRAAFAGYSSAQARFKEALKKNGLVYRHARVEADTDAWIAYFSKVPVADLKQKGSQSTRPIFIVGMPRSGTSLLEQVLASHPEIYGAGELDTVGVLLSEGMKPGFTLADIPGKLTEPGILEMSARYLQEIEQRAAGEGYVTDKLPLNFQYAGAIRWMFPNALILNIERHPMDVCWSILVQKFSHDLVFDHDLMDIAHFYRQYARLMAFWKAWDPGIVSVRYETLVSDMEATILPLLQHLGLDWHPAMARFFETDRDVLTASRLQVRRPLYKDSIARWRRFEKELAPLQAELGDVTALYEGE